MSTERQRKSATIRAVILSFLTTWPQTSRLVDFVSNMEVQIENGKIEVLKSCPLRTDSSTKLKVSYRRRKVNECAVNVKSLAMENGIHSRYVGEVKMGDFLPEQ